ncbi:hypothetical protein Tco_0706290 [Tanacetum coccineum]|uniref:Uncharacterized protein n=1 Tax=Tanacetum coccineum TaxID=301880 RepID=A0ABQ4Y6Z3_9ASTR
MLRIRLRAAEEKAEDQHIDAEPRYPLKKQRYRETPYDPSTDTTSRPRRDDPYDTAKDAAATTPTKEDDEDLAIPSDPQLPQPRGSPCDSQ